VASAHGPRLVPSALRDGEVGLALGRAVAHEIGHYLFNTRSHTADGLMRARFETRDLIDPRSPRFEADRASSEIVAIVARR
jgi:hypothetical protein